MSLCIYKFVSLALQFISFILFYFILFASIWLNNKYIHVPFTKYIPDKNEQFYGRLGNWLPNIWFLLDMLSYNIYLHVVFCFYSASLMSM